MTQTQKFTGIITRQNKRDVMYLAWAADNGVVFKTQVRW